MKTKALFIPAVLALLMLLAPGGGRSASARIKLATLPKRERVEIQLDNGRYTLVEEERIVPLLKSTSQRNNMIDFSWSNTSIDKNSILFRPLAVREGGKFRPIKKIKLPGGEEVNEVSVVNVAYPPNENALVWEVYSQNACALKVRVSYLISNLTRTFAYRALANKKETLLTLRNYIRVRNYSGEEFGETNIWAGFGSQFNRIVGQQEEIKMLLHSFKEVPIDKTFTFDWHSHGRLNADKPFASKILMHYVLTNDKKNKMGLFPLQPGKVRIFIDDGHSGEAFLGEDIAKLTPLDGKMKLYLGEARDIVCTRTIEKNVRHKISGNRYDREVVIKYEIENFKDDACKLRIIEQLNRTCSELRGNSHGDVEWVKETGTTKNVKFFYEKGNETPTLIVNLPARPKEKDKKVEKVIVKFHFTLKNLW